MIDYKNFVENSRNWLTDYILSNKLQSLIIGISGGIDSTVSCAIAHPVCQGLKIPLIGRSLPTNTNKVSEEKSADLVGYAFCDDYKIIELTTECQNLIHRLELYEGKMSDLQKGNIKARIRMIYLRNLASIHKGVVLDNDNFTEWNLGFWTVGGDSPMDINLGLHYLWKTEIYQLAHHLLCIVDNQEQRDAIRSSLLLTPTDGNGVSGSDCEQFGLDNYEQVDDVLKTMYYGTPFKYVNEYERLIDSYNEQGVDKVMLLHQNTEFKRIPSPIMPTKEELGL